MTNACYALWFGWQDMANCFTHLSLEHGALVALIVINLGLSLYLVNKACMSKEKPKEEVTDIP